MSKDRKSTKPQSSARPSNIPSSSERSRDSARRRQAQMRKRRKQKIRNTILLVILLVLVAAGGVFLAWNLKDRLFASNARPYKIENEFASTVTDMENQRVSGFASELCVSEGDVPLDSVALENYQAGTLMNLADKKVLFAQKLYDRIYPASITKIMTGILAIEYGNLQDTVTITQENLNLEEGSQVCGFLAGDQLTLEQLLYCLLVYSGNDAAAAIASHVGGTEEQFVNMMNQKAEQLGMTGTHFTNPHGLQDENHYTTVYDIYLMLQEAYRYSTFTNITQLSSYSTTYYHADGTEAYLALDSTDYYLTGLAIPPKDVTILGGKTGTTDEAGNCLALITQNAYGNPYISIVLNAYDKATLYEQMGSLLNNINSM